MKAPKAGVIPFKGTANSHRPEPVTKAVDPGGLYERAGCWLLSMTEMIGWYEKMTYTGHTLKKKKEGWLLIVRAKAGKSKRVCFVTGKTPLEAVKTASWMLATRGLAWREDLY